MGQVGRRKLCHFIIFSKNLHVIVLALNIMKLLRLFVCLIKLSSFVMPFGTGKIAGLESTMAIAASVLPPPRNEIKSQLPPPEK